MRPPGRGGGRMAADFSRGAQRGNGAGGGYGMGGGGGNRSGGGSGGFVPRGFGHRGGVVGAGHHQHLHHSSGDRRRFDSDYDFEKANEKFQESLGQLKDEFAKVKIGMCTKLGNIARIILIN